MSAIQMRCCGRYVEDKAVVARLLDIMRSAFLLAPWDGERCQVCGEPYDDVYWLPDDLWATVTPKPDTPGAGLLCPSCVVQRLSVPDSTRVGRRAES